MFSAKHPGAPPGDDCEFYASHYPRNPVIQFAMQKHNRLIANILIILSLSGVAWALWTLYSVVTPTFDPWLFPFAAGAVIAIGLVFTLVSNSTAKTNIAVIAFSTVLAAYAGNYALELTGRNFPDILDATIARQQVPVASPQSDPAPVTATVQTPAPSRDSPAVNFQATYNSYGQTSAVIPENESQANFRRRQHSRLQFRSG